MNQVGLKLIWKDEPAPQFPSGWCVMRSLTKPAIVQAPNGTEYAIGDGVLYPTVFHDYADDSNVFDYKNPISFSEAIQRYEIWKKEFEKNMGEYRKSYQIRNAMIAVYCAIGAVTIAIIAVAYKIYTATK